MKKEIVEKLGEAINKSFTETNNRINQIISRNLEHESITKAMAEIIKTQHEEIKELREEIRKWKKHQPNQQNSKN